MGRPKPTEVSRRSTAFSTLTPGAIQALNAFKDLAGIQHSFSASSDARHCLLRRVLSDNRIDTEWRQRIQHFVANGVTLRSHWPQAWETRIQRWLGPRWYFTHASVLRRNHPLVNIAASRMGRHGSKIPWWPRYLNFLLQNVVSRSGRLLLVPKTTLFDPLQDLAKTAGIDSVTVQPAKPSMELGRWLVQCLSLLSADHWAAQIAVSPILVPKQKAMDGPFQDRVAFALADSIEVLFARKKGHIESLVRQRVQDTAFPGGSVFLCVDSTLQTEPTRLSELLDAGAVGRYVRDPCPADESDVATRPFACARRDGKSIHQLSLALAAVCPASEGLSKETRWSFLSHCTRGTVGPRPVESKLGYLRRLWHDGRLQDEHPLRTLHQICADGRLLGTATLTRTDQRCVSFSSVPLPRLLDRRQFRPHLGRWDWEPFGLMIRQSTLENLGARPVIYGEESDFPSLNPSDRPLFQPRESGRQVWEFEREWRIPGDLDLRSLPKESVILFVQTRSQAIQMAQRFDWSVCWVNDI